jgi:hypothetical protein
MAEGKDREPTRVHYYPTDDEAAKYIGALVDQAIRETPGPTIEHPNAPEDWYAEFGGVNTNPFGLLGAPEYRDHRRFDPSTVNRTVLLGATRDELGMDAKTIDLIALTLSSKVNVPNVPLSLLKQSAKRTGMEQWLYDVSVRLWQLLQGKWSA